MRHFSIEEAEACLPKVESLVRSAQRVRDKIGWLLETHDSFVEVNDDRGFHFFVTEMVGVNREFHRLYARFYGILERLDELGVFVKDIDAGLIDFPFKEGKFLCWQLGEQKIKFWHDVDSGFEHRQPILDFDSLWKR
ncbi:DUF2203 domain-containing protein [Candidatus Woesearchaeota archaeon]|nr:DUF2203 domain-containing protein [Candidatus Woesearchaeota archaeon]